MRPSGRFILLFVNTIDFSLFLVRGGDVALSKTSRVSVRKSCLVPFPFRHSFHCFLALGGGLGYLNLAIDIRSYYNGAA